MDLYWHGDEVVWKNLLKHYLFCLIQRASQYLDGVITADNFPKGVCCAEASSEFQELLNRVYLEFIQNEHVKKHVLVLAADRKIRRLELEVHLGALHNFALICVGAEFRRQGYIPEGWLSDVVGVDFLGASKNIVDLHESLSSEADGIQLLTVGTDIASRAISGLNLTRRYKVWDQKPNNAGWYELTAGFVSEFCNSLEYLSYPDWYVACFMEDCVDASIWGTYGQNHSAICLKFKAEPLADGAGIDFFKQISDGTGGPGYDFRRMKLQKVSYDKALTSVDFFRSFGNHSAPVLFDSWYIDESGKVSNCSDHLVNESDEWRNSYWRSRQEAVTTKLADWHSEREYRVILESSLFDFSDPAKRMLKYKFDSLEGLVFGMATPDEEKMKVIRVIETLCRKHKRAEFSFYQAYFNAAEQKINIQKLNSKFFTLE